MGRLDSDKVDRALRSKVKAERLDRGDWYCKIYDEQGFVCSTSLSKGSKETLRDNRVAEVRRQLGLDTSRQLIDLVECRLSGEEALKIMRKNCPPGTSRKY